MKLKSESISQNKVINDLELQVREAEKRVQFHKNEIVTIREAHSIELNEQLRKARLGYERSLSLKIDSHIKKPIVDKPQSQTQESPISRELLGKLSRLEKKNKEILQQLVRAKEKILSQANRLASDKKGSSNNKKVDFLEKKNRKASELLSLAQGQNAELKKHNSKMKAETTGLENKIRALNQEIERLKKKKVS